MHSNICSLCMYPKELCKCENTIEETSDTPPEEVKESNGKIPLGNLLHFTHALNQVSRVREFGNVKYPDVNSYKQIPTEMLIDATLRHLFKDGNDEESGVNHIAHAVVNLLMILEKDKL